MSGKKMFRLPTKVRIAVEEEERSNKKKTTTEESGENMRESANTAQNAESSHLFILHVLLIFRRKRCCYVCTSLFRSSIPCSSLLASPSLSLSLYSLSSSFSRIAFLLPIHTQPSLYSRHILQATPTTTMEKGFCLLFFCCIACDCVGSALSQFNYINFPNRTD